ncbi:MAG TPA: caspase family protein [Bacteroidales bacterium]|nr:caspase family protein [Bacteroidales bacterium]
MSALFLMMEIMSMAQDIASASFERTPVLNEDFNNNTRQWITDNTWISGKVNGGYYNIICKNFQGSTGISSIPLTIEPGRDYEIEASFRNMKGVGALIFGMNDLYDHYRVEITETGTLQVLKDTPSKKKKVEKLFSGTGNFRINPDFNKITIRYLQGSFEIYANDGLVGRFPNIKTEGSKLGFNVGTDSEMSVDYLKFSYLNQKQAVQLAQARTTTVVQPTAAPENFNGAGPRITWTSPSAENVSITEFSATVKARIQSTSGLKSVLLYLNGIARGQVEIRPVPGEEGMFTIEKMVNFEPEQNSIYLVATNEQGASKSDLRYFSLPSATGPAIAWNNPADPNVIVGSENMGLDVTITSPTELKSAKLIVNGETQSEDNVFVATGADKSVYTWHTSAILKKGDNSVYISASNAAGTRRSEQRVVKFEPSLVERRLALVFGNSQYQNKSPLKNPVNDANLMEGTLKDLGFDVIKRLDADKSTMEKAIREFTEKLPSYNVALFYYAGHGIQVDGKNFLIPVDAVLDKPSDSKFEAIDVDFVVSEFEKYQENTNIVILDACRNNPYASWVRGEAGGFKAMNYTSGTVISFATSEGKTAADGTGANGLFTQELVKQMNTPQSIFNVFNNTRVQVKKLSNNQQVPMEWYKLNGDFFFKR